MKHHLQNEKLIFFMMNSLRAPVCTKLRCTYILPFSTFNEPAYGNGGILLILSAERWTNHRRNSSTPIQQEENDRLVILVRPLFWHKIVFRIPCVACCRKCTYGTIIVCAVHFSRNETYYRQCTGLETIVVILLQVANCTVICLSSPRPACFSPTLMHRID